MVRLPNWPMVLSDYLAECNRKPFQWGTHDCMAFTCGAVKALTGHDYFPEFSDYHDEVTAFKMLGKHGGVAGIISKCLGRGDRNLALAQRGDVVLVKMPEAIGGIVDDSGQRIAVVTKDGGLTRLPLNKAWRYWSY